MSLPSLATWASALDTQACWINQPLVLLSECARVCAWVKGNANVSYYSQLCETTEFAATLIIEGLGEIESWIEVGVEEGNRSFIMNWNVFRVISDRSGSLQFAWGQRGFFSCLFFLLTLYKMLVDQVVTFSGLGTRDKFLGSDLEGKFLIFYHFENGPFWFLHSCLKRGRNKHICDYADYGLIKHMRWTGVSLSLSLSHSYSTSNMRS